MKNLIIAAATVLLLIFSSKLSDKKNTEATKEDKSVNPSYSKEATDERIATHSAEIKSFIAKNKEYNDQVTFLVDMKIHSGRNRFFIYDLQSDKVTDKGLVAHGSGSETNTVGKLKFSNVNNSLCTALGKYSIGYSYNGKFGKAYKMYGLDKTNDNAYLRNIVLHKYKDVPYEEQIDEICNSYGCPMVNETFYKRIEKIIDNSDKKILLYIYY
ncbi:murein L,D-transpeptidase catalytic domain family protein [Flavobacterium amniphilum]|uniref:murein L,D-transpeptidase catalytic domain-containing protein n=1 Tax=Flavobacterium amniphilum TaxID=1834035 RepID=UPI00202A575A|nr:murein L,D-transpeptidase catalytic domain family protein [Flavobacterium amniphilum]MCL9805514.1 murein L,D-transpeptidase catalytic domain family protein [Flavobacterium amniphilum]